MFMAGCLLLVCRYTALPGQSSVQTGANCCNSTIEAGAPSAYTTAAGEAEAG